MLWLRRRFKVENDTVIRLWDGFGTLDVVARLHGNVLKVEREDDFAQVAYLNDTEFTLVPDPLPGAGSMSYRTSRYFTNLLKERRFTRAEVALLRRGAGIGASFSSTAFELRGVLNSDVDRIAGLLNHVFYGSVMKVTTPNGERVVTERLFH